MGKKVTALALALLIVLGVSATASTIENRFDILQSLDVMIGYGEGDLGLDRLVTRAEFTKMAITASKYRNSVASTLSVSPFSDVMYDSWYAPYVYLGASNKLLTGYKDGCFRPDGAVTYEEAVTVVLRLLGYEDSEFEYSWPYGQIGVAQKNGLCDGMNSYQGETLDRNQVSLLLYNMLTASVKGGNTKYVSTLDYTILSDTVLVSSYNESQSIKRGYVYTSAGLYEVTDSFNYDLVGCKGDAIIKDNKITAFLPESTNTVKYNVFSVTGDTLVLFRDGAISDYKLDSDETLYFENQKTTVGEMTKQFSAGDVIELHCDKNWDLDYVTYHESELEGPLVVTDTAWYMSAGIGDSAAVVRNGVLSSLSSIQPYDVVYYSAELQNVWAYSKKVTGSFEEALPNKDQISQIKLSGVLYDIDSVAAYKALSSSGSYKIGDRVTVLLDRDGKIVDAVGNVASGESYTVYQVVGSSIIVYKNGATQTLNLSNSDTAYLNGSPTTVGNIKNQLEIGYTIDVSRDTDGSIDYITVIESQLDGPYTVYGSSWMNDNGIDSNATIMRKGTKVSASGVAVNDIVYYSSTLNTAWAYCDTVTGIYESAEPNQDMPKSVTVSGKTYQIEGINAYNAFSSNGSVSYGDTVTLLLGKDGAVADVASASARSDDVAGFVLDAGTKEYTDASGNAYSSNYVQIVKTNGAVAEYESVQNYATDAYKNQAVQVSFVDGKAKLASVSGQNSVYGSFNYSDKKLGSFTVDPSVEIIDVVTAQSSGGSVLYKKVYPQRLDGVTFATKDIIYAQVSTGNVIKKLILNDVTGDAYSYGIVTNAETRSSGMSVSGSYTYFNGTTKTSASTNGSYFSVYAGTPVKIVGTAKGVESMSKLETKGTVSSVNTSTAAIGSVNYALSDDVIVYVNTYDYEYQAISLSELRDSASSYSITAYSDKGETAGGRIRVLVAKKK